jgi:hypothetical protein
LKNGRRLKVFYSELGIGRIEHCVLCGEKLESQTVHLIRKEFGLHPKNSEAHWEIFTKEDKDQF